MPPNNPNTPNNPFISTPSSNAANSFNVPNPAVNSVSQNNNPQATLTNSASAPGPMGSSSKPKSKEPTKQPSNPNSTQKSLLLSELRDDMVIMSDGSFRAVVACQSINFDLMSNQEREGVEYSYQNFLNSLNFPVQILIRSQRIDIGPYIEKLVDLRRSQDNMLLGVLMDDYIDFIDILSQEANIMDKAFFLVISYSPNGEVGNVIEQGKGFFGKLFTKSNGVTKIDAKTYAKAKDEIKNRVGSVMSGLYQIGIRCVQLNTKELGELYYNFYNPDIAVNQPLGNFNNVASTYVKKEAPNPNQTGDENG